jgi:hypothetical protein
MKVSTYIDSSEGVDLSPSDNLVLLFKAWLDHGPGHSEELIFSVGASDCNGYDVLWLESNYSEGLTALSWYKHGEHTGKPLFKTLLKAYWEAEKETNDWEEPNYSELTSETTAVLSQKEIEGLAKEIWPE